MESDAESSAGSAREPGGAGRRWVGHGVMARVWRIAIPLHLLAFFWALWNESFTLGALAQGMALGWIVLAVTNRFLLKSRYQERFRLAPLVAARFAAVLVVAIFKAGVHAIRLTLNGRIDPHVLDIPARQVDPFLGVLVANAITLTPGTVTVDYSQGRYKIIWIERPTTDPELAEEMIKGDFERVLLPDAGRGGAKAGRGGGNA